MRAVAFCLLVACNTVPNPVYCTASADCADVAGRPFCDLAGDFDLKNTCVADPQTCDVERPCTLAGLPACVTGVCMECDDNPDCAGQQGTPACGAAHECVECTASTDCSGTRPVCDTAAETCHACTQDGECATGACNKTTGACHIENDLVFVQPGGSGTSCTRAMPCGTMLDALNAVIGSRDVIMASGTFTEALAIVDFDTTIKGPATFAGVAGMPVVRVMGNKPVRLENVTIDPSDSAGVRCTGSGGRASLVLENVQMLAGTSVGVDLDTCDALLNRTRIASQTGLGITTLASSLTIRRSEILSNAGGGIRLDGTDYDIENTIIALNGTDGDTGSAVGGVYLASDNPGGTVKARFEFNTVAFNVADNTTVFEGFHCAAATPVTFGNSIVFGTNTDVVATTATMCSWHHSAFNINVAGAGNLLSNLKFKNNASDFHLDVGSACTNLAEMATTVTVDFDGEPRPANGRADIGADELQ